MIKATKVLIIAILLTTTAQLFSMDRLLSLVRGNRQRSLSDGASSKVVQNDALNVAPVDASLLPAQSPLVHRDKRILSLSAPSTSSPKLYPVKPPSSVSPRLSVNLVCDPRALSTHGKYSARSSAKGIIEVDRISFAALLLNWLFTEKTLDDRVDNDWMNNSSEAALYHFAWLITDDEQPKERLLFYIATITAILSATNDLLTKHYDTINKTFEDATLKTASISVLQKEFSVSFNKYLLENLKQIVTNYEDQNPYTMRIETAIDTKTYELKKEELGLFCLQWTRYTIVNSLLKLTEAIAKFESDTLSQLSEVLKDAIVYPALKELISSLIVASKCKAASESVPVSLVLTSKSEVISIKAQGGSRIQRRKTASNASLAGSSSNDNSPKDTLAQSDRLLIDTPSDDKLSAHYSTSPRVELLGDRLLPEADNHSDLFYYLNSNSQVWNVFKALNRFSCQVLFSRDLEKQFQKFDSERMLSINEKIQNIQPINMEQSAAAAAAVAVRE